MSLLHAFVETFNIFFQAFHDDLMIFMLFQATHYDDTDNAFDTVDSDRDASTMDGIFSSRLAKHVLLLECFLVTMEFVVHEPCAYTPAQDSLSFSGDPDIIVWLDTWTRDGMEQEVVAIGE